MAFKVINNEVITDGSVIQNTTIDETNVLNNVFNVTDGTTSQQINRGDTVTFTAGSGITITQSSGTVTISSDAESIEDLISPLLVHANHTYIDATYDDLNDQVLLAVNITTDGVTEGTNLYYTDARADARIALQTGIYLDLSAKDTDDLSEGTTNLYYTDARVGDYLTANSYATESYVDTAEADAISSANAYTDTRETAITTAYQTYADQAEADAKTYTDTVISGIAGTYVDSTGDTMTGDLDMNGNLVTGLGTPIDGTDAANKSYVDTAVSSGTGSLTTDDVPEGTTNLYYTNARATTAALAAVSAIDAGGDGSFSYNNTTGEFTYTGPSATEVRAHFSAGTGVNIAAGVISIGQDVSTTSTPTFTSLTTTGNVTVGGNLTVTGTTTSVNTEIVNISDNIILLNSNATGSATEDSGIEIERGDDTNVTLLWDETNDFWSVGSETFVAGEFSGPLSGNAATASKWETARTITLGGDLSGSVSIDGSASVTLTANIAANSVALGTDTTGNYAGSIVAGTGIAVTGVAGEGTAYTIAHTDTSSAVDLTASGRTYVSGLTFDDFGHVTGYTTGTETVVNVDTTYTAGSGLTLTGTTFSHTDTSSASNLTASGRRYVTGLTFDDFGHVTGYSTGTETVVNTDTNTTYSHAAVTTTGGALLRLSGSDSSADDVKFASGTNVTVTYTDANTITINAVDTNTDTLQSISADTTNAERYITMTANASGAQTGLSNTGLRFNPSTEKLTIGGDLDIGGDTLISGNLTVLGTTTTVDVSSLAVSDNLIYLNNGGVATITNAVGNGTTVTYTADNNFSAGFTVDVTGVNPSAYNVNDATITSANATSFTISSSATGTYVSGGSARAHSNTNIDLGWAGSYNNGGYAHAGLFRDATDGVFKVFDGYTPEPDDAVDIDTSHASFSLADMQAANFIGSLTGNADTSSKWASARTITLGGDLTGNVSIDGSANVTLTATIAANSVALGTDTTGNYVAGLTAGTGIAVTGTAGEGWSPTVTHSNTTRTDTTSSGTLTHGGTFTAVDSITSNALGHVTAINVKTLTMPADSNTTYSISSETVAGGANLRLTGSDSSADDVKIAGSGATTVTRTDANTITISSTDTNTTYSAGTGLTLTGTTFSANTAGSTSVTTNTASTTASRSYPIQVDASDNLVVNVPWTDTNTDTTYSAGTDLSLTGTTFNHANSGVTAGTYNNVTVNARGHVTAGSNVSYLTSETDTLNSVTGRGATTTNAITVGGLTVNGNLTVTGTTTTVNSTTVNIADNIMTLNSDVTGTPSENSGIEVERGTSANVALLWNESTDRWTFTNDGTNYYNILLSSDLTIGNGTQTVTAGTDLTGGGSFSANQTSNTSVTLNHASVARTNTTSTQTATHSGTVTVVDSITTSATGHITAVNTKTVTLPADNNTTYSAGTGLSLSGTTFNANVDATAQTVAANAVSATASRTYAIQVDASDNLVVNVPWSDTDTVYTLPAATSTVRGGIELFSDTVQSVAANAVSATASRTYGVQINSAGQAVVNVPWVDTNTTYGVATTSANGLMSSTDKTKLDGIEAGATADQTKADIDALGIAASTATKLATARTIALAGDVTGSASFDGSANISITATVADDSHNHTGMLPRAEIPGSTDLNSYRTTGYYIQDANADAASGSNYPVALAGILEVYNGDIGNGLQTHQEYHVYNDHRTYRRHYYNGTWGSWSLIWNSNTDGAGSGLDADTLDGVQGASFLRSDATDTASGVITFSNATASTSTTTGAVIITGGLGVGGAIYAGGDVTAYSDERLKENIETITDAVNKVDQLRGVTYTRKEDGIASTGVIAQDVEKVLPQAVTTDEDGMKAVKYGNMVGLLIEAIKELKAQNETMAAEIAELKARLNN